MILLKGFFRKKTTKIYMLIFSVLLISLFTLFAFINYYVDLANKIFQDYSQILIVSKVEYFDKLNKSNNFVDLEKAVVFKPNYDYKVLGRQCYENWDQYGNKLSENKDCDFNALDWENFHVHPVYDWIVVYPSSLRNIDLQDGKVALGIDSRASYKFGSIDKIKGEKIGFYSDTKNVEFVIERAYSSHFTELLISDNDFNEIYKTSDLYAYIGKIKDYRKADVEDELMESKDIEYASVDTIWTNDNDSNKMYSLQDLITILTLVSYLTIFIFSIVVLVVFRNTISDEYKNVYVERLLGYNKNQVRKYLFLKIFSLTMISFIISVIGSILINIAINTSKIKIVLFNPLLSLKIYGSMLIVSIFFCLFYGIRINKNLKSNN